MNKIGITGSIASGKSSVAKILSKNNYPIFDADLEVKKIYHKKIFKNKALKKLGVDNKVKIKKLLSKYPNKLRILEKIIHPMVRLELKSFIKKNKRKKILIFEIPLLIESKLMKNFNKIIFVNSKRRKRLARFKKRGKNKKLFDILDKRQLRPVKKIKFCDFIINNNYSLKKLKKNVNLIQKKI